MSINDDLKYYIFTLKLFRYHKVNYYFKFRVVMKQYIKRIIRYSLILKKRKYISLFSDAFHKLKNSQTSAYAYIT